MIQSKTDFQELAEERLVEAKALLDLGKWDGAYYLAGYAVELALKACIIRTVMATDAFPDKEFSKNCYVHDLGKLFGLARLDRLLKIAMDADNSLEANWAMTRGWSGEKRYHRINNTEAIDLFSAITDNALGVFPWIKTQW